MFAERVFNAAKKIPAGKATTYKALAAAAGNPKAARVVGNILNKNPNLILVPCHRVIKSNRDVGGYKLGTEKKINLLEKEGIKIENGKIKERFIIRSTNKNTWNKNCP